MHVTIITNFVFKNIIFYIWFRRKKFNNINIFLHLYSTKNTIIPLSLQEPKIDKLIFFIWFLINRYWIKRLSLFGGKWKSLIFKISIGTNDYIHRDYKNQIGLVFQLFVYILQQFKWNLLKKQVLWKASALNKNYLTEVSRNQFLYKFS